MPNKRKLFKESKKEEELSKLDTEQESLDIDGDETGKSLYNFAMDV